MDDMMLRSSLIKVDGFNGPEEFEKFVNDANVKANLMLKEKTLRDLNISMEKKQLKIIIIYKDNLNLQIC